MKTRIARYANDLGWTKIANGPSIFQFTSAQFPGCNAFSAVNCVVDQTSVYVGIGNSAGPPYSSSLVRLDPDTFAVQAVIPMPPGAWLNHLALSPGKLWATDWALGNVYRIDLATNVVDLTIVTGFAVARGVCYGNGKILVTSSSGSTAQFYDAVTGAAVGAPIVVGPTPFYIDFDGDNFWVAVYGAGNVVKIDGTTLLALATVAAPPTPFAVFADGSRVYSASVDGTITVIDQKSNAVLSTWHLTSGAGAHHMAKVRNELWIAQDVSNTIGVLDALTGAYIRTINVGKDPSGICFNGYDVFSIDYESGFAPLTGWTLRRHNVEHVIAA